MNTHIQLILFFLLAITFNVLGLMPLAVVMASILPWLILTHNQHFYRLIKRLRWFLVVMLIIYMFSTPGQYMLAWPFAYQPTYEGIAMGLCQLLRITLIVAMLSIIYQQNNKQMLVSGIYAFIKPLRYIGMNVDRFTARLWITLDYVDTSETKMKIQSISGLFDAIHETLTIDASEQTVVTIHQQAYDLVDYLMVLLVIFLLVYSFCLVK